jgi:hypothetical protein
LILGRNRGFRRRFGGFRDGRAGGASSWTLHSPHRATPGGRYANGLASRAAACQGRVTSLASYSSPLVRLRALPAVASVVSVPSSCRLYSRVLLSAALTARAR